MISPTLGAQLATQTEYRVLHYRRRRRPVRIELFSRLPLNPRPDLPPLLFIPGAFIDYRSWEDAWLPYFAGQGYACYALSQQRRTSTDPYWNGNCVSIQAYVDDVLEALRHLPAPPVLLGYSLGGYVALKTLEKTAVAGTVLVSSIPVGGYALGFARVLRDYMPEHLPHVLLGRRWPLQLMPHHFERYCFVHKLPPPDLAHYFAQVHLESVRAVADMIVLDLPRPRRAHKSPMLVLMGGRDRSVADWEMRATARAYGGQLRVYPEMSHDLIRDEGWQRVAEDVLAWLGGLTSPSNPPAQGQDSHTDAAPPSPYPPNGR